MNWFLIVILAICVVFMIRGWQKGFLLVLFSLVSVIVLIVLAAWFTPQVSAFFDQHLGTGQGTGGKLLMIVVAGVLAFVIVRLIARALRLVNKIPVLGKINRFFGLLAGLAEALILIWLIMSAIHFIAFFAPDAGLVDLITGDDVLNFFYENNPIVQAVAPEALTGHVTDALTQTLTDTIGN